MFKQWVAMEGRGRVAQSLRLKRRASSGLWARSYDWRWLRPVRRWVGVLVNLNVPRGAGSSAAALLLLARVSYGVVRGGHEAQIAENVQDLCDTAANELGFRISEIALAGGHEVSRDEVLMLAGISDHSSLLFLDAARARARLMANPWIENAAVLKLYPDRLRIEIKERKPFALWQRDGRIALIAADGTVLEPSAPGRFSTLPLVVGKGAEQTARDFLNVVARFPMIAQLTEASVLVAERRWNLHLKNGVEVLLPESEADQALRILVDLDRSKKLLSRDIVAVDLRLPDRVTIRQSDAAAAAREQVLKDLEKARKAKTAKGGEA
jgi:cell division protein FtsQ